MQIISIWAGALLLGLALRTWLPHWPGVHFTWGRWSFALNRPQNRVAFWICLTVGLAVGGVLVIKAMLRDLGAR